MPSRSRPDRRIDTRLREHERLLLGAIVAFLATCVVAGGRAFLTPISLVPLALTGSFLIGAIAYSGAWRAAWNLPPFPRIVLAAIILLPAVQLIPLPPSIWVHLPGRALVSDAFAQAGLSDTWQPLTLVPAATVQTLMQAIWLVALFVAVLPLSRAATDRLLDATLILVALHIALGVVQVATKGSAGNFLASSDGRYLIGFFANKNHSALFICFGIILALIRFSPAQVLRRSNLPLVSLCALVVVVATIATTSRAGIVLLAITLGCLAVAFIDRRSLFRPRILIGGTILSALGAAAAMSLRTTQSVFAHFGNAGDDMRFLFWAWSQPLMVQFFPVGGGFGVFPDSFATIEKLAWVKPTYVNHVHNEYIETIIEGGALSIGVLLAFAVLVARDGWRVMRTRFSRSGLEGTGAALIILLCALHSTVDYPLRRMGLAAVFFVALALLVRVRAKDDRPPDFGEKEAGLS